MCEDGRVSFLSRWFKFVYKMLFPLLLVLLTPFSEDLSMAFYCVLYSVPDVDYRSPYLDA